MNDSNGRLPNGIVLIIILTIFLLSFVAGYYNAQNGYERELRKWAIEQEYVQYNPKTGDLEVINNDIEPIEHLLK